MAKGMALNFVVTSVIVLLVLAMSFFFIGKARAGVLDEINEIEDRSQKFCSEIEEELEKEEKNTEYTSYLVLKKDECKEKAGDKPYYAFPSRESTTSFEQCCMIKGEVIEEKEQESELGNNEKSCDELEDELFGKRTDCKIGEKCLNHNNCESKICHGKECMPRCKVSGNTFYFYENIKSTDLIRIKYSSDKYWICSYMGARYFECINYLDGYSLESFKSLYNEALKNKDEENGKTAFIDYCKKQGYEVVE